MEPSAGTSAAVLAPTIVPAHRETKHAETGIYSIDRSTTDCPTGSQHAVGGSDAIPAGETDVASLTVPMSCLVSYWSKCPVRSGSTGAHPRAYLLSESKEGHAEREASFDPINAGCTSGRAKMTRPLQTGFFEENALTPSNSDRAGYIWRHNHTLDSATVTREPRVPSKRAWWSGNWRTSTTICRSTTEASRPPS